MGGPHSRIIAFLGLYWGRPILGNYVQFRANIIRRFGPGSIVSSSSKSQSSIQSHQGRIVILGFRVQKVSQARGKERERGLRSEKKEIVD